ncbi:MAG: hypothetical protein A2Y10_07400 [Planctomycetes bacterium GWF2_41_51]|nr:MAG: hypothetical protein A2Y10_07400 [Planctomycetes bacterium GWF2_41_51]HBG27181.1 hypothetical protein [Phycisphaerales bacterium]
MNIYFKLFFIVFPALYIAGCSPDLKIEKFDIDWDEHNKKVNARIENTGGEGTGPFLVHFAAEEEPVSPTHSPLIVKEVKGLGKKEYVNLTADFAPLARPENVNLANVKKILIVVDPTGLIKESDEKNNIKSKSVP